MMALWWHNVDEIDIRSYGSRNLGKKSLQQHSQKASKKKVLLTKLGDMLVGMGHLLTMSTQISSTYPRPML
jgi:hypothetical protein